MQRKIHPIELSIISSFVTYMNYLFLFSLSMSASYSTQQEDLHAVCNSEHPNMTKPQKCTHSIEFFLSELVRTTFYKSNAPCCFVIQTYNAPLYQEMKIKTTCWCRLFSKSFIFNSTHHTSSYILLIRFKFLSLIQFYIL